MVSVIFPRNTEYLGKPASPKKYCKFALFPTLRSSAKTAKKDGGGGELPTLASLPQLPEEEKLSQSAAAVFAVTVTTRPTPASRVR